MTLCPDFGGNHVDVSATGCQHLTGRNTWSLAMPTVLGGLSKEQAEHFDDRACSGNSLHVALSSSGQRTASTLFVDFAGPQI